MNFKAYLEILESEGLEESPLVDGLLTEAMKAQKQIAVYAGYEKSVAIEKEIRRLEEVKLESIWEAIDLTRMYPPDSDMHKMTLRAFQRTNKREYKGFLNEYRMMEVSGNAKKGAQYHVPPELQPVADRISKRWDEAMKRTEG